MYLQGRNLSINLTGADVVLLHTELAQLGYTIPAPEIKGQLFGPGTLQSVQDFQRKRGLPVTGIVDPAVAKAINAAVEAIVPASFTVSGTVRHQDGTALGGIIVRAVDKELRGEKELGETKTEPNGHYQITYTRDKLARPDKTAADLVVRAFSPEGGQLAASAPLFKATATATVDLTVASRAVVALSEYEQVLADIGPRLGRLALAVLGADDIALLAGESGEAAARIVMLQQSQALAKQTRLAPEAFYAWMRQNLMPGQPPVLDPLLALPDAQLRQALSRSVTDGIIPASVTASIDGIIGRIAELQRDRQARIEAAFVRNEIVAQLVDQKSGDALAGFRVQSLDLDAGGEPKSLGYSTTNPEGFFALAFAAPPAPTAAAPAALAPRRLRLNVTSAAGQVLPSVDFSAPPDSDQPVKVSVSVPAAPQPPSSDIAGLNRTLNLGLPEPLLAFLAGRGIRTLADIRNAGGIGRLPGLPVAPTDPAVKTLEAHARLERFSADPQINATLIAGGFTSAGSIARASRSHFVSGAQAQLGDAKAAELQVAARAQTALLHNGAIGFLTGASNGFGDTQPGNVPDMPDISGILPPKCGCEDCEAAVSPLAYLADLLDYAVRNVRNNGKPIDLSFLTATFHQLLGDLPASCEQMDQQVRQVRICIEVLRSFMAGLGLSASDQDYCLQAYETLLQKIGTSFAELRLARKADLDSRQALADRLGIELNHIVIKLPKSPPDNLELLLHDDAIGLDALASPPTMSEAALEALFGLVDTTHDPLSDGVKFGDTTPAQIFRWEFRSAVSGVGFSNGIEWGRNTDRLGNIYVSLDHPSANAYRVRLFKDAARSELVAEGTRSSPQGPVQLAEQNGSGLMATFEISYGSNVNVTISAVSQVSSWRLAHLRKVWLAQDKPVDLYSDGPLPKELQDIPRPPIIDPDLIGPDDFRNPVAGDLAFNLWLARRHTVDAKLKSFDKNQGLDAILQSELQQSASSLDSLLAKLATGSDSDKAAAQDQLNALNLIPESLAKLAAFRATPPVDGDWPEIFSILTQASKVKQFEAWRTEEQTVGVRLGPQSFWISLREPTDGEWPPFVLNAPLIDPDTVKLDDLPEPVVGAQVILLWTQRRQQLDDVKLSLRDQRNAALNNSQDPLAPLAAPLSYALGDPLPLPAGVTLDSLSNAMSSPDPAISGPALATINGNLFMSLDDFLVVMDIRTKLASNNQPADSEWNQLFAILTSAKKAKDYYAGWLSDEQSKGLTPVSYWLVRKAALPRWRASAEARALWQQALRLRNQPPVIDPDLIGPGDLRNLVQGDPAYDTWNARYAQVGNFGSGFWASLKAKREAEVDAANGLNVILTDALGISSAELAAIDQQRKQGTGIDKRLAQLPLPMDAFVQLMRIHDLVSSKQSVLASEWEDVYSILTQVKKRRLSAQWREEENAKGLMLGPDHFQIPPRPPLSFPPQEPPPLPAWRATRSDLQDWQDTLQSRIDQQQGAKDALAQAVGATEEVLLPQLRDALVWQSAGTTSGTPLAGRAKWLQDRLLIDCSTSGCQMTTRVAQAIETVQVLLFSLREEILAPPLSNLSLEDVDEFDLAWQWLGSYPTWRAAMFVFLYPENILIPSLARRQTPAFQALVDSVRSNPRLTPEQASDAADTYASYFSDVCKLKLEATCQTRTRIYVDGRAAGYSYLFYMFARSPSGTVYWSAYVPEDGSDYAQSFWEAVPGLANAIDLIGASPYETPWGDRFVYLFATLREKGVKKLVYSRYDLEKRNWDTEPSELDLPDDASEFSAVLLQAIDETTAPQLLLKLRKSSKAGSEHLYGILYHRKLNEAASDWADADWRPLTTPALGNALGEPVAWVQTAIDAGCVLVQDAANGISYRLFAPNDDGHWQRSNGGFFADFRGAFRWPGTPDAYVASVWVGSTAGAAIKTAQRTVELTPVDTLEKVETWLNDVAGLSLKGVHTETMFGTLSLYDLMNLNFDAVLAPAFINVDPVYRVLSPAAAQYTDEVFGTLFRLQQFCALLGFVGKVEGATDFRDKDFGAWQIAHGLARYLSDRKGGLFELIAGVLPNWPGSDYYIFSTGTPLRLKQTNSDFHAEFPGSFTLLPYDCTVFHANGSPPNEFRQFGFRSIDKAGGFRGTLSRSGDNLEPSPFIPIAPAVTGPLDIKQRLSDAKLQTRAAQIKNAVIANLKGPRSNLSYLDEAYYFVQVHLALQLQARGEYTAALDWFRNVYDYAMPPNQRKIFYGLVLEEKGKTVYQRAPDWLLDPLNPHEIAATRPHTYSRFTIMSIVRCLLDYADAEFTLDTPETVARARALYLAALDLLDTAELRQKLGPCDDIIGELDIEVGDPIWWPVYWGVRNQLGSIVDLAALKTVVAEIKPVLGGPGPWSTKLTKAQGVVRTAVVAQPAPQRVADVLDGRAELEDRLHSLLLTDVDLADATQRAGALAAQDFQNSVSLITGVPVANLKQDKVSMPWLRQATNSATPMASDATLPVRADFKELTRKKPLAPTRTAMLAEIAVNDPITALGAVRKLPQQFVPSPLYHFCIPPNPILQALRLHAELNLYKLRTCRNIAGMKRDLDPYAAPTDTTSGMPVIGAGGQLVLPGLANLPPTPYRYPALIERAKQMVALAQQVEASFLSVLEKADVERYSILKVRQDLDLARAGVRLQTLRVKQAQDSVKLADLQQQRAQIQVDTYKGWLSAGMSAYEIQAIAFMVASASFSAAVSGVPFQSAPTYLQSNAAATSTVASINTLLANYEQRLEEWRFQEALAQQDVLIGAEQVTISEDNVRVTDQELTIAQTQVDHDQATIDFLANKFTNAELYDWMGNVLQGVYSFFLQHATALAQLSANQLAFERQEVPPPFIQADYWQAPGDVSAGGSGKAPDRRGLTGSARLLQDIYQLDQYAFDTNTRKLQLSKTISLASLAPAEFQHFRESGVLNFATPMEMFDRDFPGHYLRLIRRVKVSVIALIPPSLGIRATLATTGTSRVVIGGDIFQTVRIYRGPEEVALSSPRDATGLFELDQQPEMLLPFEGIGVDTHWQLRMPKAANLFDYTTIADVLLTIDYTALKSFDYEQQVIATLRPTLSSDRPFSFRYNLGDAWYDLHNPDQSATPMVVEFTTSAMDFLPNLGDLKIQQIQLYFSRADGQSFEVPVADLRFTEDGGSGPVGGGALTVDGLVSTRQGNGGAWAAMIGRSPFGTWELSLPNQQDVRDLFDQDAIQDVLFVVTYSGRTPAWPN